METGLQLGKRCFKAKNTERKKFCEDLERENGKENVFRLAKQLVSKNRDVVSVSCVKDDERNLIIRMLYLNSY